MDRSEIKMSDSLQAKILNVMARLYNKGYLMVPNDDYETGLNVAKHILDACLKQENQSTLFIVIQLMIHPDIIILKAKKD
jgi:hypothetical protein